MLKYILWRLASAVPVMTIGAVLVFLLIHIAPGDPAALVAGENATPSQVEQIRQRLHLDKPLWEQFIIWSGNIIRLDLGDSIFSEIPVSRLIAQRLEATAVLAITAIISTIALAVPMGVIAATRAGSMVDRVITFLTAFAFSIPPFLVGYGVIYVFALKLKLVRVQGYSPLEDGIWQTMQSVAAPSLTLAIIFWALIARITRSSMIEILQEDYIRTARAKGLGEFRVVWLHALKNAGVPISTVIGIGIAIMISGVVVTESVFNLPGIGRLTVDAVVQRDFPVVQGVMIFFTFALVIVNLLVDLSYALFDPRLRR